MKDDHEHEDASAKRGGECGGRDGACDAGSSVARAAHFARAIDARTAHVGIIGLGSVGLPLASAFVEAGFHVLGFDRDREKLARLERGENTLHHLEEDLVLRLQASGRFAATSDPDRLVCVDAALICVPTPLAQDRKPDLECVTRAARTLARNAKSGALVVLESTTYPGTTRNVVGDVFRAHGRCPGDDVLLAYSPEREDPGRRAATTATIPKLVGGTCPLSGDLAQRLYSAAIASVHRVSSAEVAESAKLFENVFRAVNIALANELKVVLDALKIDVWEVIEAAATKPFGFMKFTPGPGMGGHCIPIDPYYLAFVAREVGVSTRFVELAGEINRTMPSYVALRTRAALEARGTPIEKARILILGLAYKPDVDIVTESPSVRLIELFEELGAYVRYSDPLVPIAPEGVFPDRDRTSSLPLDRTCSLPLDRTCSLPLDRTCSLPLDAQTIAEFDALVVATNHACFDYDLIARHAKLVVDTRHALASRMQGDPRYATA